MVTKKLIKKEKQHGKWRIGIVIAALFSLLFYCLGHFGYASILFSPQILHLYFLLLSPKCAPILSFSPPFFSPVLPVSVLLLCLGLCFLYCLVNGGTQHSICAWLWFWCKFWFALKTGSNTDISNK